MPKQLINISTMVAKASVSRKYSFKLFARHTRKCVAKFIAASSINTISTNSITAELKYPTLASCVENPPNPIVENAWHIASSQDIPATFSDMVQTTVIQRYTSHKLRAVSVIRGVRVESFIGPGVSALYN